MKFFSLPTGVYRHYKGKFYLVLGIAQHSETQERLVVYVPLYEHSGAGMSVRPLEMFCEMVSVGGKRQKRFQYLGDEIMSADCIATATLLPQDSIELLGLSARAFNFLKYAGIVSIEDLTSITAHEVAMMKNCGRHSLMDVRRCLAAAGYKLKDD